MQEMLYDLLLRAYNKPAELAVPDRPAPDGPIIKQTNAPT
jgi:hypothetical protein